MIEDIKPPVSEHPVDKVIESGNKFKKRALRNKKVFPALVIVAILVTGFIIYSSVGSKNSSPFAAVQKQNAPFAFYYPQIPAGYRINSSSVTYQNQILFYNLSSGNRVINISEQAAPANPPDFDKLQKSYTDFTPISTLAGKGIVGVVNGVPVGILLTNTTLVNINATKDVPKEVVAHIAQNMSSLSL
jgi:hypothetical protein